MADKCFTCKQPLEKRAHGATVRCCSGAYFTVNAPAPRDAIIARDLGLPWATFNVIGLPHYVFAPALWWLHEAPVTRWI